MQTKIIMIDDEGNEPLLRDYAIELSSLGFTIGPSQTDRFHEGLSPDGIFVNDDVFIKYLDYLISGDPTANEELETIQAFTVDHMMKPGQFLQHHFPDSIGQSATGEHLMQYIYENIRDHRKTKMPLFFSLSAFNDKRSISQTQPFRIYTLPKVALRGDKDEAYFSNCRFIMHEIRHLLAFHRINPSTLKKKAFASEIVSIIDRYLQMAVRHRILPVPENMPENKVDHLLERAAEIAKKNGRDEATEMDIIKALDACVLDLWPICKKACK